MSQTLWLDAHIDREDPAHRQTLRAHCREVAQLAQATLAPVGLGSLGYLAGLLHDFGKARPCFQEYLHESDPEVQRRKRGKINHSAAGAQFLATQYDSAKASNRLTLELLALAITGHHGFLSDCLKPDGTDALYQRVMPPDVEVEICSEQFIPACADRTEISERLTQARAEAVALFRKLGQGTQADIREISLGLAARLLLSAVVDADRYNTMSFTMHNAVPKQETADREFWAGLCARLDQRLAEMPQTSPLNGWRQRISDACAQAASQAGGVYRLSAPTGGGKTLSSLRFALHHARIHEKARIFYIIPYTTILDQTAQELRRVLGDEPFIVEHHSGVVWEGRDPAAPGKEEELDPRECYTERWNAPIVLTTMVQFLDTLFAGRNGCVRRMQGLTNAVLIFDEIQSIPTHCIELFSAACSFLSTQCGATILLCTATQPAFDQIRLPLQSTDLTPEPEALFAAFRRTELIDLRERGAFTADTLAAFADDLLHAHSSLLIVLNTKSAVRRVFEALTGQAGPNVHLVHLSTSMCGAHRKAIVADLRTWLAQGERVICVSTQLIEAGIDLSFSCVIRSLAGLENIAQAAGRCNRHGEDPNPHPVYVIAFAGENLQHLPEIAMGQTIYMRTLHQFPGQHDLLSPAVIDAYYRNRYQAQSANNLMSYPLSKKKVPTLPQDDTMCSLLGMNKNAELAAGHHLNQSRMCKLFRQSFATAGAAFRPIESTAVSVIVPYKEEGRALIAALLSAPAPDKAMALLRQAQQFAVGLFPYEREALERAGALCALPDGTLILQDGFYNEHAGLQIERGPMALLAY